MHSNSPPNSRSSCVETTVFVMRLIYDALRQALIIEFRPLKKGQVLNDRREILAGIWMGFNFHGQLMQVEITQTAQHGPELNTHMQQLITTLTAQLQTLPQELLISSTGPLKLTHDPEPSPPLNSEQVRLFYDSGVDMLQLEMRRVQPGETIQQPRELTPGVFGFFDQNGQVVRLDVHQALRHYPHLKLFIDQGHELLAAEKLLRTFGRR